jgi:hypothetical protein
VGYLGWTSGLLGDIVSRVFLYIPIALGMFGFFADAVAGKYHYSVSSFTGIIGMGLNKLLGARLGRAVYSTGSYVTSSVGTLGATALGVGAVAAAAPAAVAALPAVAAAAPAAVAAAPAAVTAVAPLAAASAVAAPVAAAAADSVDYGSLTRSLGTSLFDDIPVTPATRNTSWLSSSPPSIDRTDRSRYSSASLGRGRQRGGAITCTIPGFEWLENNVAPQGLVMSMTVLFYILIEMWDTGQTSNSLSIGVVTLIVFLLQSLAYVRNGCIDGFDYGKWSLLISLVMGIVFAGSSYGIVKAINKNIPKSSGGPSPPPATSGTQTNFTCPVGTQLSPEGNCVGVGENVPVGEFQGEKSSPVNPDDQFVCEAYKDGELITSTIAS